MSLLGFGSNKVSDYASLPHKENSRLLYNGPKTLVEAIHSYETFTTIKFSQDKLQRDIEKNKHYIEKNKQSLFDKIKNQKILRESKEELLKTIQDLKIGDSYQVKFKAKWSGGDLLTLAFVICSFIVALLLSPAAITGFWPFILSMFLFKITVLFMFDTKTTLTFKAVSAEDGKNEREIEASYRQSPRLALRPAFMARIIDIDLIKLIRTLSNSDPEPTRPGPGDQPKVSGSLSASASIGPQVGYEMTRTLRDYKYTHPVYRLKDEDIQRLFSPHTPQNWGDILEKRQYANFSGQENICRDMKEVFLNASCSLGIGSYIIGLYGQLFGYRWMTVTHKDTSVQDIGVQDTPRHTTDEHAISFLSRHKVKKSLEKRWLAAGTFGGLASNFADNGSAYAAGVASTLVVVAPREPVKPEEEGEKSDVVAAPEGWLGRTWASIKDWANKTFLSGASLALKEEIKNSSSYAKDVAPTLVVVAPQEPVKPEEEGEKKSDGVAAPERWLGRTWASIKDWANKTFPSDASLTLVEEKFTISRKGYQGSGKESTFTLTRERAEHNNKNLTIETFLEKAQLSKDDLTSDVLQKLTQELLLCQEEEKQRTPPEKKPSKQPPLWKKLLRIVYFIPTKSEDDEKNEIDVCITTKTSLAKKLGYNDLQEAKAAYQHYLGKKNAKNSKENVKGYNIQEARDEIEKGKPQEINFSFTSKNQRKYKHKRDAFGLVARLSSVQFKKTELLYRFVLKKSSETAEKIDTLTVLKEF